MKGNIWKGELFTYVMKAHGNANTLHPLIDKLSRYGKGISLDVLEAFDNANHDAYRTLDVRDSLSLFNQTFNQISKERLKEYGIGCCRIECDSTYKILFYPL